MLMCSEKKYKVQSRQTISERLPTLFPECTRPEGKQRKNIRKSYETAVKDNQRTVPNAADLKDKRKEQESSSQDSLRRHGAASSIVSTFQPGTSTQ
ncbi:hypothetical protein RRG08_056245 [Elysia crispata]|uniref:Uncharacterized protein n=1 Tax=Elysia crispata TaxID=231223 RepID=A0AAE1E5X2_9GAST|nr:hypothetical protein RRG08_056245 [Elysia crispata]